MSWERYGRDWILYEFWTRGYYDRKEDNDQHGSHNWGHNGFIIEKCDNEQARLYDRRNYGYFDENGKAEFEAYTKGYNLYIFDDGPEVPTDCKWFSEDTVKTILDVCKDSTLTELEKCTLLFDQFPGLRDYHLREHGRL